MGTLHTWCQIFPATCSFIPYETSRQSYKQKQQDTVPLFIQVHLPDLELDPSVPLQHYLLGKVHEIRVLPDQPHLLL